MSMPQDQQQPPIAVLLWLLYQLRQEMPRKGKDAWHERFNYLSDHMKHGDQLLLPGHDSHEFREGYESAQKVRLALGNISAWNSDKVSDETPAEEEEVEEGEEGGAVCCDDLGSGSARAGAAWGWMGATT